MQHLVYRTQRNWGARIREVTYYGIRMIILENEKLRIGILAGKGADIVELNYKPRDLDFVWLSPAGVRNPLVFTPTAPDPHANFRDNYPGGWQEVFPNGGNPSSFNGADFGQHGEVFNVPWDVAIIEDTAQTVAVRFSVRPRKIPVQLEKTITLRSGDSAFEIDESIVNESPVTVRAMWGHHITFGKPFLKPGCQIRLPNEVIVIPHETSVAPGGRRVSGIESFPWPIDPENGANLGVIPEPGTQSDLVYITNFPQNKAWYEIFDPTIGCGARLEWATDIMPFLWFWQEFGSSAEYPWYGRNFNVGLEPFSSMPSAGLAKAVENDTALHLEAGKTYEFCLVANVFDESDTANRST